MKDWFEKTELLNEYLFVDENDFLREKCTNIHLLTELIAEGERILWKYDEADRFKFFGKLGNLYRIKGDLALAIPYLEHHKHYMIQFSDEQAILALIRYAEALKYDRQYEEAIAHFEEALERGRILKKDTYEHVAWQQLGKCYVEFGDMKQAESCFLKALLLRQQMGDQKLLLATERALNFMMNIKK
jgi:HTH-type transcriptional regulator, pleiotropic regulator of extracellular virulence genes